MKQYRFRIFLIALFVGISLYLLYPTYKDYQNSNTISVAVKKASDEYKQLSPNISEEDLKTKLVLFEDSLKNSDPGFRANRLKRIKLGLDLQGGMRVVLEVNTAQLLKKLAQNVDNKFNEALAAAELEANANDASLVPVFAKKLQESGGRLTAYYGNVRDSEADIITNLQTQADDAVKRAMEIIRNRVDQYGVSEPVIQLQGARRVVVELPGVAKEEEARQLLQGTALLEFKIVKDPQIAINVMNAIDQKSSGIVTVDTLAGDSSTAKPEKDSTLLAADTAKTDSTIVQTDSAAQDTAQLSPEQLRKQHPFYSVVFVDQNSPTAEAYVIADDRAFLQSILTSPPVQKVMEDNNVEVLLSAKPLTIQDGKGIYGLYVLDRVAQLTGGVITDAKSTIDQQTSGAIVTMSMNAEGSADWARITGANIDKRCAIVLDGVVYSAPVIRSKITGGNSQIEGMGDLEEAKLLEIVLKAGALPAPVDIIEERTVGPSLGEDSINAGFNSALFGYLLVAIFMIFYYQKSGGIAAFGLSINIVFILGILAFFKATLTLPGIAGIVLTMGMAVDANVLIYERIREELATGKTVKASVEGGFAHSASAIWDSNITTFFTGLILYQFGTGPVQGFALTLMIGIGTSLFTALVFARLVFDVLVAKNSKISIG